MKTLIKTLCSLFLVTQICFAQWVQTNGPYGGSISAIVTDGINLYAGTVNGVYISTNNGSSWTSTNSRIPASSEITSLAINGNYLFAGTSGNGVFRTTNNGISWSEANSGLPQNAYVNNISISPNETGGLNLFAVAASYDSTYSFDSVGIYLSTDNGFNWTAISTWTENTAPMFFPTSIVTIGKYLFVGASWGWGLRRFLQNDTSWTMDTVISNNSVFCLVAKDTNLFAGTYDGVLLSTDYGSSWVQVSGGLPSNTCVYNLVVDGNNLFARVGWEGEGIYISTDNGLSWSTVYSDQHPNAWVNYITDFAFIPNLSGGKDIFAGTRFNGVYRSTNNVYSWAEVNTGIISDIYIYDITAIPNSGNQSNYIASAGGDVYLSSDNGISWSKVDRFTDFGIYSFLVCPNESGGNNIFAGGNGVFISTDNGISWESKGLTNTRVFCFARNGSNIFAGTEDKGIFLSSNKGTTWSPVNSGLKIDAVQFLYLNGVNLFAGTNSSLFLSTNDGGNWNEIIKGLPKDQYELFAIRDLVARGPELFLGTSHGVFYSTDDGNNWVEINSELKNEDVMALAISPDGKNIFAGTYGKGLFFSSDNGAKWTDINSGLTNLNITKLYIDPEGKNLFAGTGGAGLWYRPLSELVTTIPVELRVLDKFTLEQNYPNPFNPTTKISWQSPVSGRQVLKVFDLLGNEVATLVNGYRSAGNYEVEFDASHLASGIYFYQLKVGEFISTKKMILSK